MHSQILKNLGKLGKVFLSVSFHLLILSHKQWKVLIDFNQRPCYDLHFSKITLTAVWRIN